MKINFANYTNVFLLCSCRLPITNHTTFIRNFIFVKKLQTTIKYSFSDDQVASCTSCCTFWAWRTSTSDRIVTHTCASSATMSDWIGATILDVCVPGWPAPGCRTTSTPSCTTRPTVSVETGARRCSCSTRASTRHVWAAWRRCRRWTRPRCAKSIARRRNRIHQWYWFLR